MNIIHRVSLSGKRDLKVLKKFKKLGIELKESAGHDGTVLLYYFDISEDNSVWPVVNKLIESHAIPDTVSTKFTDNEICSAKWVRIYSDCIQGYPMPYEDGSWRDTSFDCNKWCQECGMGMEQKAPLHLTGELEKEENDFASIFWTYTIFARPEVLHIMSENDIKDFEVLPVINHSTNAPLDTLQQMKVTKKLAPSIIVDDLKQVKNKCEHIKYLGPIRSMLKYQNTAFTDSPDLIRTSEWFGSGHAANQLILASSKFVKLYIENNWKGLVLQPIELV